MKHRKLLLPAFFCFLFISQANCQRVKIARYLGAPIWTDSSSTLFIPTRYNEEFLSANKIALWSDYYANIIAYDFVNDSYKTLFDTDTYIEGFRRSSVHVHPGHDTLTNITARWVFFLVKSNDYDHSNRIDGNDPSILYVVTRQGEGLRAITPANEHVLTFQIYEKQGFALVTLQRDSNGDHQFKYTDRDLYYRRIDLKDCSLGKPIENGSHRSEKR